MNVTYLVACKICGNPYESKINRRGYCEKCRLEKLAESKHKYYLKRKEHNSEIKDLLKPCAQCGKLFDARHTSQTLCDVCQLLKERNYKMSSSNEYRKNMVDCIQFKVPKGKREVIKAYAAERGMNLTELILESLKLYTGMEL